MSYSLGLTIESLVAILLLLTIIYCARLNSRLERLRADEQSMRKTIVELVTATENAERAIAGLKFTVRDCQNHLDPRLREAEVFSAAITEKLKASEDVITRLRKIVQARDLLTGAEAQPHSAPDIPAVSSTKAMVAAAQAFAERTHSRINGHAA